MARSSWGLQRKRPKIRLQSAPLCPRLSRARQELSEALSDLHLTGGVQIPLVGRRLVHATWSPGDPTVSHPPPRTTSWTARTAASRMRCGGGPDISTNVHSSVHCHGGSSQETVPSNSPLTRSDSEPELLLSRSTNSLPGRAVTATVTDRRTPALSLIQRPSPDVRRRHRSTRSVPRWMSGNIAKS